MQFEDPTDELQTLRESLDVERSMAVQWLPELAATVSHSQMLTGRLSHILAEKISAIIGHLWPCSTMLAMIER